MRWTASIRAALIGFLTVLALADDASAQNTDLAEFMRQGAKLTSSDERLQAFIGNTMVLSTGRKIYWSPDGRKIMDNGRSAKWYMNDAGKLCDVRFLDGVDICDGDAGHFPAYHLNGLYRTFNSAGGRVVEFRVAPGKAF